MKSTSLLSAPSRSAQKEFVSIEMIGHRGPSFPSKQILSVQKEEMLESSRDYHHASKKGARARSSTCHLVQDVFGVSDRADAQAAFAA